MSAAGQPARVLIVTFGQIVPPSGGIAVRSVIVARCLAELGFRVHLLSVGERDRPDTRHTETTEMVDSNHGYGLPDGAELTPLSSHSMFALGNRARNVLRSAIADSDVVIVESALLLPAVVLAGGRRAIIWDTNECETLHYARLPTSPTLAVKRLVWYWLERWSIRIADVVVSVSAAEASQWVRLFPRCKAKLMVADHAVLRERRGTLATQKQGIPEVVFVGDMHAKHNHAAVMWTLEHVLPVLAGRARLVLAGSGTQELSPSSREVELLGFVDDLSEVLIRADVCIAPLLAGAGVKTKMLDYVRQGCRILATPPAIEGIEDCPGVTVATLAEFPQALLQMLEDPESAEQALTRREAQAQWYEDHCGQDHLIEQWTAILERVGVLSAGRGMPLSPR